MSGDNVEVLTFGTTIPGPTPADTEDPVGQTDFHIFPRFRLRVEAVRLTMRIPIV
jgi:hypothetical protein